MSFESHSSMVCRLELVRDHRFVADADSGADAGGCFGVECGVVFGGV